MSPLRGVVPNDASYGCNNDCMDHDKVGMKCHLAHINGENNKRVELTSASSHHLTREPPMFKEEAADSRELLTCVEAQWISDGRSRVPAALVSSILFLLCSPPPPLQRLMTDPAGKLIGR